MKRNEFIDMLESSHNAIHMDMVNVHGIPFIPFDRVNYDSLSDADMDKMIRDFEEAEAIIHTANSSRLVVDSYSDDFYETVYTADGSPRVQLKQQLSGFYTTSGFRTYNNSHGHCPLCGRLGCNGYCFK